MEKETFNKLNKSFEKTVHETDGVEFWLARELQELLGYYEWRNFIGVIEKAKIACKNAAQEEGDHFVEVNKTIKMPKGASKFIGDIMLTRYACYLIAQNGDPHKDEIAFAMSYFAIQTRKQELLEKRITELERLQIREKLSYSEKMLSGMIFEKGADGQGFAMIKSKGDQALFGGHNTSDMKKRLGVPNKRSLADFLPTITIKAKDFANEITIFNLKKDSLAKSVDAISLDHEQNNRDVRKLLLQKGIRPEDLPAEEDVKKLQRKLKSDDKLIVKNTKKLKSKE